MELGWTMLANYAEDNGGLLSIQGGGWDTITAHAPLRGPDGQPLPNDPIALFQGFLITRIRFHQTEVDRDHSFEVQITDADGASVGHVQGEMRVPRIPGVPPSWSQNVNIVIGLSGMPLPRAGLYSINVLVDGQHIGDQPFRVIKGY